MDYTNATPEQLIRFRSKTGLNQVEFGKALYVGRSTVQNWERGVIAIPPAIWELAHYKMASLIAAYELRQSGRLDADMGNPITPQATSLTRSDTGA